MPAGRVLEIEAIPALESLPAIAAPPGLSGARAVDSPPPSDGLVLADTRPFHVELGHASVAPSDEAGAERGKHRT
jgi:hypothetical protein